MNIQSLEKRIGISLPAESFKEICFHSSFQPQDKYLRLRNKQYVSLGYSVIKSAYSLYIYNKYENISSAELSDLLRESKSKFSRLINEEYSLDKFEIIANKFNKTTESTMAAKLVALIFQTYGFYEVYRFLLKFFLKTKEVVEYDSQTVVQEYAQAKGITPVYEFINSAGLAHEKKYTCRLRVGSEVFISEGIGKKRAKKATANLFIKSHNLSTVKIINDGKNNSYSKSHISETRRKELNLAVKIMKVDTTFFSYTDLNEILTHKSILNIREYKDAKANDCIMIVGDSALQMIGYQFILDNYDLLHTNLETELGQLLYRENLASSISNDVLKCYLTIYSVKNNSEIERFKNEIFKSIVGMLLKNSVKNNDDKIYHYLKSYIYNFLTSVKNNRIPEYNRILREIVQEYKWSLTKNIEIFKYKINNEIIYKTEIFVSGINWTEYGIGFALSKKKAYNSAAQEVLLRLISHCPDSKFNNIIYKYIDSDLIYEYYISNIKNESSFVLKNNINHETLNRTELKQEYLSFDFTELHVYLNKNNCSHLRHNLEHANGVIPLINGKNISIEVNYCCNCNEYFLEYSNYRFYKHKYGLMLGNVIFHNMNNTDLLKESVLKLSGYTVNSQDNLHQNDRQKILANLINKDIISKERIISYLNFFINNAKYRDNMKKAVEKWRIDILWLKEYNVIKNDNK